MLMAPLSVTPGSTTIAVGAEPTMPVALFVTLMLLPVTAMQLVVPLFVKLPPLTMVQAATASRDIMASANAATEVVAKRRSARIRPFTE